MEQPIVGRQAEQAWVTGWLTGPDRPTSVLAVNGIPGIGKTFLLRHLEHLY